MAESALSSRMIWRQNSSGVDAWLESHIGLLATLALVGGFIVRIMIAHSRYLVADEALDYLLINQPSALGAYRASLTNAHPPLYYFVLYYCRFLGTSELMLRLPSAIAGTLMPWFAFLWLKRFGRTAAFLALLLLTFTPALINFSTEIRPYALLLLFLAAALWGLDRAFDKNSPGGMLLFGLLLCLAILTQYSAIWAVIAMGIYALARIVFGELKKAAIFAWTATQAWALAVLAFLWVTHISKLHNDAMESAAVNGWLRTEYFHAGDHVLRFVVRATAHTFFYLLTRQTQISPALSLRSVLIPMAIAALFVFAAALLLANRAGGIGTTPRSTRLFGALVLLPFAIGCAGAIAGLYPYGGSRHVAYLAPFLVAGIAISIAWLSRKVSWAGIAATVALLVVCTMRVEPLSYISPADQASEHIERAVQYIHESVPAGGILVVDYNSSLVARYYLCSGKGNSIRSFESQIGEFSCGTYEMARARGGDWNLTSENLGPILAAMEKQFRWKQGRPIWLVQAAEMRLDVATLERFGLESSKEFGLNVSVSELRAP